MNFDRARARLEVDVVAGRSAATAVCSSNPMKLLLPRPRGASVWACVASFGGGFVAGDETSLDVRLGANARCFLSTQASTKIYRNPNLRPCSHRLHASLANGSLLVLAPDPIQAFAGSTYVQRQDFHLHSGAGLVMLDWLCSGRTARGERWAFTRLQGSNELFIDGERILIDSLLLDPSDGPLSHPHRLGRFNCLAVIIVIGSALAERAARLLTEIAGEPVLRQAAFIATASPLRDGVLLRMAGERVEDVGREIRKRLGFISEILEDDPWARKW
ncbi:MAG TPA: urease accessory protein UreD [Candidatus Saccharimonadales bacterium]|nr:urease accessory protein UreD [Candidatus Saccharimonadales bacterium]